MTMINDCFTRKMLSRLLLVILLLTSLRTLAGYDPVLLSHSTVRVLVKRNGRVLSCATGFLWQRNDQIVTALHVMNSDPGTRIIIEFGNVKRLASIVKVLAKADLVLLKIDKPVVGWQPLTHFSSVKPKYQSDISALGYNRGSAGLSSRDLKKGYVYPEILQVLLPPDVLKTLNENQALDVKLPIYYLDGSLLPGYSGAPVVDSDGVLIGIGNGGLANGTLSVSWVIPASNLTALTQSRNTTLADALPSIHAVF
ncbi:MAG: trypsin-like peptidase domain-containing protein [Algicola sp.]|nr:trypsin-like peptidase domain-containing protein [Algicola sp.]